MITFSIIIDISDYHIHGIICAIFCAQFLNSIWTNKFDIDRALSIAEKTSCLDTVNLLWVQRVVEK